MPTKASAKKMLRKDKKRNLINKSYRSMFRNTLKKVQDKILSSDKAAALSEFVKAQSIMHSISSKGIYHLNKASRLLSRLSKKIKLMPGEFNGLKKG